MKVYLHVKESRSAWGRSSVVAVYSNAKEAKEAASKADQRSQHYFHFVVGKTVKQKVIA